MISTRGSRPKMASDSSIEPASLPSSVVTFNFISHALLLGSRSSLLGTFACEAELARLRRFFRQSFLHRIAHRDPAALGAGNGTFDEDQAAFHIELHDAQVECGDAIDTHVTG